MARRVGRQRAQGARSWAGRCAGTLSAVLVATAVSLATGALHAAPADDHDRGRQAWQRGDVVAAMDALRPAATAGHVPSQLLLAFILDSADFPDEATALYRKAAEAGDAEGHAGLANAYLSGRGIAKDEKLAVQHFSKAAALSNRAAIEVLALAWAGGQLGLIAAQDPAAARRALEHAAGIGHAPSAEALARAYAGGGLGQVTDAAEATRWKARAAELRQQQRAAKPPAPRASR